MPHSLNPTTNYINPSSLGTTDNMAQDIEEMASFCKKKGFVFPSAEIYGGIAGFYDYGPLGTEFRNNLVAALWKRFVQQRDDVAGIDGSIITHASVWKASGHVDCFEDVMVECPKCKQRMRADHLVEEKLKISVEGVDAAGLNKLITDNKIGCPQCKSPLTEAKKFNLMFDVNVGPVKGNTSYLRPETAQLIFTNFKLVAETSRLKLPFGIAQVGKAFRNEISPRDFLFRTREFEQFEIEFFVHPDRIDDCEMLKENNSLMMNAKLEKEECQMTVSEAVKKKLMSAWHAYWISSFYRLFLEFGIPPESLRIRQHHKDELAHYARACFDIEYKFPFGWKEIHGCADRKNFDITQHSLHSKKDLSFFDEETKQRVVPDVIEPSQGIGRAFLALLFNAYNDDKERENVVLKLAPELAPVKAAVFPLLSNNDEQGTMAKGIVAELRKDHVVKYDRSGSIGRRYARNDEIGTPYCITVDFDSLTKKDVTIRDRDTTSQKRVKRAALADTLRKLLNKELAFKDL